MKLATAAEMQGLDRTAIEEFNIPGIVLMENAGRGTVEFMVRELGPVRGRPVIIFAGPGNNGGDGLVIARHLHQLGGRPFIFFLVDPERLQGDAAVNFRIVRRLRLPMHIIADAGDLDAAAEKIAGIRAGAPVWSLVDAIFGTGLKRPLAGRFLATVNLINRLRHEFAWPVTAVDIPSGLDADNGQILGGCAPADLTATYGLVKPGHVMHGGADLIGKLHCVDIGIPPEAVSQAGLQGETLDRRIMHLLKKRKTSAHKGNFGHLLVLAGSGGKTGAAILSGLAALRAGTGLVTLAVPHELNPIFEASLVEAMTIPLPHSATCLSIDDYDLLLERLRGKDALVIGPGIGTAARTRELVLRLYRELDLPMVVDADGLNILAMDPDRIARPPAPRILTPHPGEMARLAGLTSGEIQADRLLAARRFVADTGAAVDNGVTLILKGAGTIICDPDGSWAVNTTGNPGMAAGGMGDVLSGLVGGLLAQGCSPAAAARLGVYLHGLAADRLAQERRFGYLASEVAAVIPDIITMFFKQEQELQQGSYQ
ncbi:bifunctional NAD(P)H-hydrate repair enzyme Nnr [bacterium BMS3Bbin14]|nr:bifunctional NAD(P)H-hydrate repair enzyme Nnr [bacterium BMS3Abin13]GBE53720.1 bifunctional NAD(P)H-hydrate repair enzyme Nnr [bacterium BMS3Bbin14]HDK43337.1 NAD(P)H-hydrate dehydratase [Desulfobacteraceae bacterium]HDO31052.1 NAD(P)H-hydrate dehydratase [Desulfobacteraceae bacterium]HDZ75934.1 NAD(P)H-hydrate dehydratase [Desulfobacteraceae bacterium]